MYWYLTFVNRLNLNYLYEGFKDISFVLAAIPSCSTGLAGEENIPTFETDAESVS